MLQVYSTDQRLHTNSDPGTRQLLLFDIVLSRVTVAGHLNRDLHPKTVRSIQVQAQPEDTP